MIRRLRSFFFMRRHLRACRDLQRMVDHNRNSPACRDYRRHRAAMLTRRSAA